MLQAMFALNYIAYKYRNIRITGCGLDVRGYISGRTDITPIPATSRTDLRLTCSPMEWEAEAISSTVKRLKHEANHPPSSSAKCKGTWSLAPLPLHASVI
jgi:hypothetical protein